MRLNFSDPGEDDDLSIPAPAIDGQEPGTTPSPWPERRDAVVGAVLRAHAVPEHIRRDLLDAVGAADPEMQPVPALAAAIERRLPFAPWTRLIRRRPLLLAGPPGAGKTSAAAKLAARLPSSGRTLLLNTDTARAGSAAQIESLAAMLGCRFETVADVDAAATTAAGDGGLSPVIIDTAGIDPLDAAALRRLETLITRTRARPVLVLPASIEAEEAATAGRAFARLGVRHVIVTRLDMVRRLGGIFAAAEAGGLALAAGSFTGHVAYGLRALTPAILARRLFAAAMHGSRWRTF
jgi:flagellar biosynthesis protein FlhF